jgi:hypothetical protein
MYDRSKIVSIRKVPSLRNGPSLDTESASISIMDFSDSRTVSNAFLFINYQSKVFCSNRTVLTYMVFSVTERFLRLKKTWTKLAHRSRKSGNRDLLPF